MNPIVPEIIAIAEQLPAVANALAALLMHFPTNTEAYKAGAAIKAALASI
jgi:hypothetical protein